MGRVVIVIEKEIKQISSTEYSGEISPEKYLKLKENSEFFVEQIGSLITDWVLVNKDEAYRIKTMRFIPAPGEKVPE